MAGTVAADPAPVLTSGLPVEQGIYQSSDGVTDLQWDGVDSVSFELEERRPSQEFRPRYQGTDLASIRSGLSGGVHEFRVRAVNADGMAGPWSEHLTVKVTYMEAGRLRLLLFLGGFVVLATIVAIVHGHFSHQRREEKS